MTEADVIPLLIEFMHVLLAGISVYFTIVSAYVVGLYAFLVRANIVLKIVASTARVRASTPRFAP